MNQERPPTVPVVVDPRLAAPRGAAYSAGALIDEEPLDDAVPVHYYPEGQQIEAASTTSAIDASNKGFQLLQKMGWKGKGLGRNEDGIAEPVKAGVDAGVRLGLGKQQEDDKYTDADGITRRKLEVEIQADEDPERMKKREALAQREEAIKQDVTQILKTFYCQVCNKQYTTAMELEEHLSSYDHHHKKRLAEARAAELERTRDERQRREQRRQQKEQQRMEEQIRKAHAAAAAKQCGQQQQQAPPPPPPPPVQHTQAAEATGISSVLHSTGGWNDSHSAAAPPPPPPPPAAADESTSAAAVSSGMSFGIKVASASAGRGLGRTAAAAGGRGLAGMKRPAAAMQPAAAQKPAPPPAASNTGVSGLGFKSAGYSTAASSDAAAAAAAAVVTGGLGYNKESDIRASRGGLGFQPAGGSSSGFKPAGGFSRGGGPGFKVAGLGSKPARPVSAAFGDSSDEEGG